MDTKKTHLDEFVDEGIKAENPDFNRAALRVLSVLDRMDEIFVANDPLLSSQGPVTPYYWLVRNASVKDDLSIREFLVKFEEQRKKSKSTPRVGELAEDLKTFELMNRSTNDQGSLNGRYNILLRWFDRFLTNRDILDLG